MSKEIIAKSGAKILIAPAPWQQAKYLKMAIERELLKGNFTLTSADLTPIISTILQLDGSPEVEKALMPCLACCTYNAQRITDATFDKPDARGDYFEIVEECIRINLTPLWESLCSRLIAAGLLTSKVDADAPESK